MRLRLDTLGACLSTSVAGIGDTSHGAMACLPRFLVMQVHTAEVVRAAGSRQSWRRAQRSQPSEGSSFTSMVLMDYIDAPRTVYGSSIRHGRSTLGPIRRHASRTVVERAPHVVVGRHTVAILRRILVSSAPTRTGDSLMVASESGHTTLGNFSTGRKIVHVTPRQHVTLAPILH
jgi:hypothetical protein